ALSLLCPHIPGDKQAPIPKFPKVTLDPGSWDRTGEGRRFLAATLPICPCPVTSCSSSSPKLPHIPSPRWLQAALGHSQGCRGSPSCSGNLQNPKIGAGNCGWSRSQPLMPSPDRKMGKNSSSSSSSSCWESPRAPGGSAEPHLALLLAPVLIKARG
uniref:Uncharacterized protein n=1 Tax=Serinus canaria TaxID=9135 RepID=A0A8C9MVP0_SERCA